MIKDVFDKSKLKTKAYQIRALSQLQADVYNLKMRRHFMTPWKEEEFVPIEDIDQLLCS